MAQPVRLQLSRRAGFKLQEHSRATNGLPAVKVTRPGLWGNPWPIAEAKAHLDYVISGRNLDEAIEDVAPVRDPAALSIQWFRLWITGTASQGRWLPPTQGMIVERLAGKNLACWCKPGAPCHADVLLELANRPICEAVD
ncbi:DUF4326 domain-containing protein [Bosea sp. (in: a-proteobacteria)]